MKRRLTPILAITVALALFSGLAYAVDKKHKAKPANREPEEMSEEAASCTRSGWGKGVERWARNGECVTPELSMCCHFIVTFPSIIQMFCYSFLFSLHIQNAVRKRGNRTFYMSKMGGGSALCARKLA